MSKKRRIGLVFAVVAALAGFASYVLVIAPSMPLQSETSGEEQNQGAEVGEASGEHIESVGPAVLSGDGHSVLVVLRDRIAVWDLVAGRVRKIFAPHYSEVTSIAVSPDGKTVASASADGMVRLWDIATAREVQVFSGHSGSAMSVAFSPDGHFALSAGREGNAILWDIASGRKARTFVGAGSFFYANALFAPDGRSIWSASGSNRALALWDIDNRLPVRDFARDIRALCLPAFSSDGLSVAVGNEFRGVRLFDTTSGRLLRSLQWSEYRREAEAIAFSPDGRSMVIGSRGGTLRLWDVAGANTLWGRISWAITPGTQPRILASYSGNVESVAFTADGGRILSAGNRSVTLLDVATGEVVVRLRVFTDDSWLVLTGSGFYDSSGPLDMKELRNLVGVKGLERCSDAEIEQALHRPDLVAETLSSDGAGKVKAAIAALDLDKACPGGSH